MGFQDRPFAPGVIQPGMERVVQAGDSLVIEDANGQEFAIKAIEGEATMEFLTAFDEWYALSRRTNNAEVLKALWTKATVAFNQLPLEIHKQLPSWKSLGTQVRAHTHG